MACLLQALEFRGKEYRHKLGSEDRPLWKKIKFIPAFRTTGTFLLGLRTFFKGTIFSASTVLSLIPY